jgi:hypothetical protein
MKYDKVEVYMTISWIFSIALILVLLICSITYYEYHDTNTQQVLAQQCIIHNGSWIPTDHDGMCINAGK